MVVSCQFQIRMDFEFLVLTRYELVIKGALIFFCTQKSASYFFCDGLGVYRFRFGRFRFGLRSQVSRLSGTLRGSALCPLKCYTSVTFGTDVPLR